ncbi:MAG: hypothetical protein HYX72_14410 [Acidobacteria bacterium]|nr:hypothetical protein [Acidobacteriota bacterium]
MSDPLPHPALGRPWEIPSFSASSATGNTSRFVSVVFQPVLFFFDDHHPKELIRCDFVEGKRNAEPEGSPKIKRPAEELSRFGVLRGIEPVEWAMLTPTRVIRRVRTKILIAQLVAPEHPVDKEAQRGAFRPLRN